MKYIFAAVILFLIAAFSIFMSVLSFMEKGFLFNNAYIYASKQERETMDKKPHYRQSAIVFLFIGAIFLLNGLAVIFRTNWSFYITIAIIILLLIYAIVSSINIEQRKRRQ